ncbi:VOC family protein [Mucilaginibacter glaciei]|uniref:VOC family protein n=1 Tax=Mucilaginibacter glaciei TaxID=2772109 RepID=A0A926NRB4_9SPHI|nr:VOC family protein [Mucilaginibacter glaciei]MBD1393587.1 VOC family protein [Mucilaginibacter glaciei]
MKKDLWMNLPVKDLNRAKAFYTQIGFTIGDGPGNSPVTAPLIIGEKKVVIMLFQNDAFKNVTQNGLVDTTKNTEVMFSFGAESEEEINQIADKVQAAGGDIFAPPAVVQGWMYGFAFCDPDGHRWNALYMDMSKMKG